jgi:protein SCO1/2
MISALSFGNFLWSQPMSRTENNFDRRSVGSDWAKRKFARRSVLSGLAATLSLNWVPTSAHDVGPVKPPIEVPNISVMSSEGLRTPVRDLLRGQVTAVQLMFSRCKSICPIEAATLARVQEALGDEPADDIQLLSLSVDPITDTPEVLRAWLKRFGAGHRWIAAAPTEADLPRVKTFFDRPSALGEVHSTAVSLVDRGGFVVWRTLDLPAPNEVAMILLQLHNADLRTRSPG